MAQARVRFSFFILVVIAGSHRVLGFLLNIVCAGAASRALAIVCTRSLTLNDWVGAPLGRLSFCRGRT
jgi:hypothetical protein